MADAKKKDDPAAEARAADRARRLAEFEAQLDREEALASVPQKVVDGNEHAALLTQTGQKPERDLSDAPPPADLGVPATEVEAAQTSPKDKG